MKTTYKGVETTISDNLFEKPIIKKNKPRKSMKFGELSLYYNGVYYFPKDIKETIKEKGNRLKYKAYIMTANGIKTLFSLTMT